MPVLEIRDPTVATFIWVAVATFLPPQRVSAPAVFTAACVRTNIAEKPAHRYSPYGLRQGNMPQSFLKQILRGGKSIKLIDFSSQKDCQPFYF
jgi:hypothetical protein